jgi:acyl-[acyl-carrier-protein] desaturase
MNHPPPPKLESDIAQARIYKLYRDYFAMMEKKRRWNVEESIPWGQCNPELEPVFADLVETFCAVELYLPDYLSKLIPQVRAVRGRAWMLANWGYEESKHSLALGDWLVKSGRRTEEQMADLEGQVFAHEWNLPYDNARAMVCYTTLQELATYHHYNNLRRLAAGRDPALDRVLTLLGGDERVHYNFFAELVSIYLEEDREETLEQLRRVANTFQMPAYHMFADTRQREADVRDLRIFDDDMYLYDVLEPALTKLGLTRKDLRRKLPRESVPVPKKG